MATHLGISVKDVNQHEFVKGYGTFLKKSGKLKVPEWVDIVKTGIYKELAPYDADWYYIRCAAVARHTYCRSPVGVGALTKIFGGKKRNGTKPSHFCRGSSSVARKALQSLEGIKVLEKGPNGGRIVSSQGRRDMDRIASQIAAASRAAAADAAAASALEAAPVTAPGPTPAGAAAAAAAAATTKTTE